MRASAPLGSDAATERGISAITQAHAPPAKSAARTYLQREITIEETPNCIGLPAYQNAGSVRIQKDAAQATAIPSGPHGSATKNRSNVTTASMKPQRNHRSGLPMER